MSDEEKRPDPEWNEIPTHPSLKKGREPTPRPAWMNEKPKPEPEPPPIPQQTKFSPEEKAAWDEATKIPEEITKNLDNFLLMIERMKKDPASLKEFNELISKEFLGD